MIIISSFFFITRAVVVVAAAVVVVVVLSIPAGFAAPMSAWSWRTHMSLSANLPTFVLPARGRACSSSQQEGFSSAREWFTVRSLAACG